MVTCRPAAAPDPSLQKTRVHVGSKNPPRPEGRGAVTWCKHGTLPKDSRWKKRASGFRGETARVRAQCYGRNHLGEIFRPAVKHEGGVAIWPGEEVILGGEMAQCADVELIVWT